ncbi:WLM-domain-containing protein [Dentipellis sp. KUC8613]|nr:WLM-domain-containing protein [Dentipellis sp. KUC8613]
MSETFVLSFTHLKGRPKADQALPLLQRIASLVKPIMRKHGWKLPVLAEFFPESPNLLGMNVNGGQKILLRLRPASVPDTFYPEEDLIGTMLHELTHNVHGPHDDKFYKFLAELEEEYEALQRSGYAGEGFHSKGNRLGQNVSHDLPPHLARQRALEAAEKRRKIGAVLGSGGRLGGGSLARSGLSPRQLAALAAERRANDEKACGSGDAAEKEAKKAAEDSIQDDVIDLTGDSDDDVILVDGPARVAGPSKVAVRQSKAAAASAVLPAKKLPSTAKRPPTRPPSQTHPAPESSSGDSAWSCTACTLINDAAAFKCEACLTPRPTETAAGWTCTVCGERGINHQFWTCTFCGSVKTESTLG